MKIRHSLLEIISSFPALAGSRIIKIYNGNRDWFRHSEFKMRSLKVFIVVLVIIVLSSCSSVKEKVKSDEDETEVVQEMTVEAESREPIYVYRKEPDQDLKEVTLTMNSQPVLLTSGYIRLVGVVSGPARNASRSDAGEGKPMALIEVGGKGLCVGVGEEVEGYKVTQISDRYIRLENINKGG